jgi:hypothetical protein
MLCDAFQNAVTTCHKQLQVPMKNEVLIDMPSTCIVCKNCALTQIQCREPRQRLGQGRHVLSSVTVAFNIMVAAQSKGSEVTARYTSFEISASCACS